MNENIQVQLVLIRGTIQKYLNYPYPEVGTVQMLLRVTVRFKREKRQWLIQKEY